MGIGGEKTDRWHWGVARAVLTASVEIPKIDTSLNVAYAPSYRPGADSRRTHHEVSIYLDRTLWARLRQ